MKVKTKMKGIQNQEMTQMFNQMLDPSKADSEIVYPKYNQVVSKALAISRFIIYMGESPIRHKYPVMEWDILVKKGHEMQIEIKQFGEIQSHVDNRLNISYTKHYYDEYPQNKTTPDTVQWILRDENINKEDVALNYSKLKESNAIQLAIQIAAKLTPYKDYIKHKLCTCESENLEMEGSFDDKDNNKLVKTPDDFNINGKLIKNRWTCSKKCKGVFDREFINDIITTTPLFKFSTVDLYILCNSSDEKIVEFMLNIMHLLYINAIDIHSITTSPDVNVDEFAEVIMTAIDQVQTQPGLNRCGKAFHRIKESVGLLKENFGGYYKDMIQSNNPAVLMESFVVDVAKSGSSDPQLVSQFRQITNHFQKMSQQNGRHKDEKLQALFKELNSKIDMVQS